MKSKLIETDESVFIENIPKLEWGENHDNSFIRSAQIVINSLGESYTYDFLMGISGAGFRLHFHPDWCPSSADSTTGFDVSQVLFKSIGYDGGFNKINDNSFDDIRSLYKKIVDHINQGIPVIAINLRVCPEWGIVTGYLKNKPGLLCRTYYDGTDDYSLAQHAPWLTFFIDKKDKPLDEKRLFKNSLEIAIKLATTDKFEEYISGFKAFDRWVDELKKYEDSIEKKAFKEHEVNLTIFNYLLDSRRSAFNYLTAMNNSYKFNEADKIINNYRSEVKLLEDLQQNMLPPYNSKPEDWTKDILNIQIDVLSQALALEKESIQMIKEEI